MKFPKFYAEIHKDTQEKAFLMNTAWFCIKKKKKAKLFY